MDETGSTESFKRFALALYGSEGVADACLYLQNRHDLDVNLVLLAVFVGAERRQTFTTSSLEAARARVDGWHREVVRPVRAVRQRLKTGPAPAPNDVTARLRRQVQQVEIDAELIELDQLGALIPVLEPMPASGSATECAAAAIETVIKTHTGIALNDEDRQAIGTIAAEAHQIDAGQ
jgi:uncharacterized protein (TIGR02444 family)